MYKEKMEAQSYAENLKMEMHKEKMEAQSYAEISRSNLNENKVSLPYPYISIS